MDKEFICMECGREWLSSHYACLSCGGTIIKKEGVPKDKGEEDES